MLCGSSLFRVDIIVMQETDKLHMFKNITMRTCETNYAEHVCTYILDSNH